MTHTTLMPDYQGDSIVNLMSSLIAGLGGQPFDPYPLCPRLTDDRVAQAKNVMLLVIDGLGDDYLRAHAEAKTLNALRQGRLTSVFPSTTASAITTFLTGLAPQQHALTGWHMYFRELGAILAVLPGRARFGGGGYAENQIDVRKLLELEPVFNRIDVPSHLVSPEFIANSGFNPAMAGRGRIHPYKGLRRLFKTCAKLASKPGRKYIYAYWPELDAIGHRQGMHGAAAVSHLAEIDRELARFIAKTQGSDTLLMVTADHGQIDTQAGERLTLDAHPELADMLALPLCGEPRAAHAYVRNGAEAAFEDYLQSALLDAIDWLPSAQAIEEGWFGLGEPNPRLFDRCGDYLLLPRGNRTLKDWLPQEKRYEQVGTHGGLSAAEMRVPLLVAEL